MTFSLNPKQLIYIFIFCSKVVTVVSFVIIFYIWTGYITSLSGHKAYFSVTLKKESIHTIFYFKYILLSSLNYFK